MIQIQQQKISYKMGNQITTCLECPGSAVTGFSDNTQSFKLGQKKQQSILFGFTSNRKSYGDIFSEIKKQINKSSSDSNIFGNKSWNFIIDKISKSYLSQDQKLQLLEFVINYLKVNSGHQTLNSQINEFCDQFGKKISRLLQKNNFRNQKSLQYAKFMTNAKNHQEFSYMYIMNQFPSLVFKMSQQQVKFVAQKVKLLCAQDLEAFAFISLFFIISFENLLGTQKIQQVIKQYENRIKYLQKLYPANEAQISSSSAQQLKDIKLTQKMQQFVFKQNEKSHIDQLRQFILEKALKAKEDLPLFQKLAKHICYEFNGYGFKSGLKIKGKQNQSSIQRTIEKLIDKEKYKKVFDQLKKSLQKGIPNTTKSSQELQGLVEAQILEVEKKISQILQKEQSIEFDSKDLVRGKCTFSSIEDILAAGSKLMQKIKQEGHQVIQLKNRLQKGTKDVTLIIKLPNSIAELQLALQLDSTLNEFNHKIYELKRSTMYTTMTNLFVLNKIWCEDFFIDQIQRLQGIIDGDEEHYHSNFKFSALKQDIKDFQERFLIPNRLQFLKHDEQKQKEKMQLDDKIAEIQNIINSKYENIDKKKRKADQKINEAIFLKNINEYEKALQTIQQVSEDEIERSKSYLKLKGDILFQSDNVDQSLPCYLKSCSMYESEGKQDENYRLILRNIGASYYMKKYYNEAIQYYSKLKQLSQQMNGKNSLQVAEAIQLFGTLYIGNSQYLKGLQEYKKCYEIKKKLCEKDSLEMADILYKVGFAHGSLLEDDKCLDYFKRSLQIRKKIQGQNTIGVANMLLRIGVVYTRKKDYRNAKDYLERCEAILLKTSGDKTYFYAEYATAMAVNMYCQGDYQAAQKKIEKAIQITRQINGQQSLEMAAILLMYAKNYEAQHVSIFAFNYAKQSLQIRSKILGEDHPLTKESLQVALRAQNKLQRR